MLKGNNSVVANGSANSSSAASPVTANHKESQLSTIYDQEWLQSHLQSNHQEIGSHLYHRGFLTGFLSDITVRAFDQAYHLHRLILIRSPFFESLLLPSSPAANTAMSVIDLATTDPNINQESLSICLAYLYGAPVYSHIKFMNVYSVLACANYFQLNTLCQLCVDFIVKTMAEDTVMYAIGFLTCGQQYEPYSESIREACTQLLCVDLPKLLNAFNQNMQGQQRLLDLYIQLPFDWLKHLLEERLTLASEFEKYQFAKQVIERRKVGFARSPSSFRLPFHADSTGSTPTTAATAVNENVVLLFDSDAKGRVSVVEHFATKKPAYVKHQVPRQANQQYRHQNVRH